LALCLSGELRKHKHTYLTHIGKVLWPNEGHAYVASWIVPDDGFTVDAFKGNVEYYEDMYKSVTLVAVRIDFFHPNMFDSKLFKRNTAKMFFLIEACTRLVMASGVVYHAIARSRLDLTFHSTLFVDINITNRGKYSPFVLKIGNKHKRRLNVTKNTFVVYDYTYHCINDWFAIGPPDVMLKYGLLYSIVQSGASPHMNEVGCWTEACISWVMRKVLKVEWIATDVDVQLGPERETRQDVGKGSTLKCRYR